ncbi:MAG: hypothetical protein K8S23_16680, partial [Candidatus Cloacimonetes bacterium]|nr:hypothetical protein [Candidatus Cloacimonadota bacterium]
KPVRFRYGLLTDSKSFDQIITENSHLFHLRPNGKLVALDLHQLTIQRIVTHRISLIALMLQRSNL